jgi:hypothetical protein
MITTAGGTYFIIEHARVLSIVAMGWLGLSLFTVLCYNVAKRLFMIRLVSVWGDVMPETPDARETENDAENPAAISVPCPTCKVKRGELCRTTAGNLEMRMVHQDRTRRYTHFLARHWSI